MLSPITEKLIKQLKKSNLTLEDRTALVTELLDKMNALPLSDVIVIGQGTVSIQGRDLDTEQIIAFRENCIALKDNPAEKLINEQIRYLAQNLGVYKAQGINDMYFYKAALWILDQKQAILDKII